MPFVFGPSGFRYIGSREICRLRTTHFAVNEKLHFNSFPRRRIVHGPTRNRSRLHHCFTPSMKRRRKRTQIRHDRNRANQHRLCDGFADQQIDKLWFVHAEASLGFGSVRGGNSSGQRVLNSLRTISSTSSAVAESRHFNATSRASLVSICERVERTRGIIAGVMLRSMAPSPTSRTA